jgi:predicted nucleic acid-binding protein
VIYVLDACAMIAYLRDETGADVVEAYLADEGCHCSAHAVNLCEVYYDVARDKTLPAADALAAADDAIETLLDAGVELRDDIDPPFWKGVGQLKMAGGIALADCFAIALAQRAGAELLTSDHKEFDPVAAEGLCLVTFIR